MYVIGCTTDSSTERGAMSGCFYLFNDRADGTWHWDPQSGDLVGCYKTPLPYGISTVFRPPSFAEYGGRLYITGYATYNLVIDEHHRCWKQGIRSPEAAPTITGATGTGAIGYISWYDEMTGERSNLSAGTVISTATPRTWTLPTRPPDDVFVSDGTVSGTSPVTPGDESARTNYLRPGDRVAFPDVVGDLSYNLVHEVGPSGVFTCDNTGLTPGSSKVLALPFTRATHCELWLSIAGGLPQLVMRVPIGTTSVVESTAVASLGESFIGSFERFPRCSMNVIWNDRQLMAGDPDNPDTVYMSELFFPERWAGLSFRTRDGAPVTGILPLRDYCLIFSRDRTYMLQGFTEADFSFQLIEQSLGSIGHRCNAVVHGSAYVWTEKGPYMYNGSWHPLSPDNIFTVPPVAQNTAGKVRAMVDPDSNTFTLISPQSATVKSVDLLDRYLRWNGLVTGYTEITRMLVFDYTTVQPEAGGSFIPARLSIDYQQVQQLTSSASGLVEADYLNHYLVNKWGVGAVYLLSQSTEVTSGLDDEPSFYVFPYRRMNAAPTYGGVVDGVDTHVVGAPDFVVVLGHYYFDDIGGSHMEGKTFKRLWFDIRSYFAGATLTAFPGDDDALELFHGWQTFTTGVAHANTPLTPFTFPIHMIEMDATADPSVGPILRVVPEGLSGRGLSFIIRAPWLGAGASFRGFGGAYIEGPASRYGLPFTE